MSPLTVEIPAAVVDAIADAVIARLPPNFTSNQGVKAGSPWLNVDQAAQYIGDAPSSRVYDLTQQRKLTPHRDGRRLLFHRDDLDAYLRGAS
jgi:excisionase family DNA binding protein